VALFDTQGRRVAWAAATRSEARFSPAQTRALGPGVYFASVRGGGEQRLVVVR